MTSGRAPAGDLAFAWYDLGGDGTSAFLLHGATSFGRAWQGYLQRSSLPFHWFAMDQRGHGDSPTPPSGYDAVTMGEDAAAVWQAIGTGPAVVFGASMGGNVALAMAALRPDLVRAAILSDPAFRIPPDLVAQSRAALPATQTIHADWSALLASLGDRRPPLPDDQAIALFAPGVHEQDDGTLHFKWDPDALRLVHDHFLDNLEGLARRVRVPVLVVQAGDRRVLPDAAFEALLAALPDGERVTIPGTGHSVHNDDPVAFDAAVHAFMVRRGILP